MSDDNNSVFISSESVKRLIRDIKDIKKNPLHDEGIYYIHDDTNMLEGYAYICGPKDSVYYGGNYFYKFTFPNDYPYRPPKVEFLNGGGIDGKTRFHPNMYKNGKICLSILNTWRGDQWTGCQTIRSILLTILSILDSKPLLHEPGFTEICKDFIPYNKIITYKNFEYSVNYILNEKAKNLSFVIELFKNNLKEQFLKNKSDLNTLINDVSKDKELSWKTGIYSMHVTFDWKNIKNDFKNIKI